MPRLSATITANGPILKVTLAPDARGVAYLSRKKKPIPRPVDLLFLVDTGASHTLVDVAYVIPWRIPRTNFRGGANSLGSTSRAREYRLSVTVHGGTAAQGTWVQSTWPVTAVKKPFRHNHYAGLIGRDLLKFGVLEYDGRHNTFAIDLA
jgi:hypothetical protein